MRRWLEIAVVVPASAADAVADRLIESGAPGIREEEAPGDPTRRRLVAHFADAAAVGGFERLLAELEPFFPGVAGAPLESRLVDEEDWAEGWRQAFPPIELGRRLRVRPPWERSANDGRVEVVIEPAMAFGTGQHASTHGCLLALEEALERDGRGPVLDVGTGSGILAIAAVLLGATRAVGVDTDPIAIAAARENASRNFGARPGNRSRRPAADRRRLSPAELLGIAQDYSSSSRGSHAWRSIAGLGPDSPDGLLLGDRLTLAVGGVESVRGRFGLVLANLYSGVLATLLPELVRRIRPGGSLVLSGLLAAETPELVRRAAAAGLVLAGEQTIEGWSTLVFRSSHAASA